MGLLITVGSVDMMYFQVSCIFHKLYLHQQCVQLLHHFLQVQSEWECTLVHVAGRLYCKYCPKATVSTHIHAQGFEYNILRVRFFTPDILPGGGGLGQTY